MKSRTGMSSSFCSAPSDSGRDLEGPRRAAGISEQVAMELLGSVPLLPMGPGSRPRPHERDNFQEVEDAQDEQGKS